MRDTKKIWWAGNCSMRQRCDDSVLACTASPPRAACRCSAAKAARKGGGVQRSPSTPQLEDFMSKALFSLVVFVAVLAITPFAHSATASEVRPTSLDHHTCTQQHFRLVIHNCFLSSHLGNFLQCCCCSQPFRRSNRSFCVLPTSSIRPFIDFTPHRAQSIWMESTIPLMNWSAAPRHPPSRASRFDPIWRSANKFCMLHPYPLLIFDRPLSTPAF